ncbi:MFS transporter [Nocardiopsis sp. L17-MgMaSL7]|uniref:MFS transporter n=1 Tax=Nocardiopsis sp. L17-MgMaSL7 TaxID=1938893 RepID=UPI000D70C0F5|nr:MFS transporter [Nocardiopsis sp. L17-MgMaSL7]PWV57618.1 fucose permease [Nocardiopsis sp. L17-MgMaSL7]
MIVHETTGPTVRDRRARVAVGALFFTNGALFANLIPRYPQIKADLELGEAAYGLAVAAFPAGAIAAGLGAAVLIRLFGSARVAVLGTVATGAGTWAAAFAPSLWVFAAALLAAGAMDSLTDVGQNAHGLRVQRRYGRSILNNFHAVWSIGAVTGGTMAATAIAWEIPRQVHLGLSAVLFSAVALWALRWCLPGPDNGAEENGAAATPTEIADQAVDAARRRLWVVWVLVALVLLAISGSVVEDAGSTWAAVYLSGSLGAPAAVAATGFIAMVGAQFVGRMIGDRCVDLFGQRAVARVGGALTAVGMGLALAFPTVPGTLVGLAVAGLGMATLIPAAMHAADQIPGLRPGTGLTVVSWLMRLGFLLSPPLVGLVAEATSVRLGLTLVPVAGLAAIALAGVLSGRTSRFSRPTTQEAS